MSRTADSSGRVWCVFGVLIGVLFASGFVTWFRYPFEWVTTTASELAGRASAWFVQHVTDTNPTWGQIAVVLTAVMIPGLIAVGLVVAAEAGLAAKRAVAGLLTGIGFLSFFVLPWHQAAATAFVCTVLAVIIWLATGPLLAVPLVATATAMAVTTASVVWEQRDDVYLGDAQTLSTLVGWPTDLWRIVLIVAACVPFLAAVTRAVFGPDRHPEPVYVNDPSYQ